MNLRPSGYEPDELPDCSTPRRAKHGSTEPELIGESASRERTRRAAQPTDTSQPGRVLGELPVGDPQAEALELGGFDQVECIHELLPYR